MEKNIVETIIKQIQEINSEQVDAQQESKIEFLSQKLSDFTKEQYSEISIGLKQVKNQAAFSAKEVIDSLR